MKPNLEKDPAQVSGMFDRVALGYDRTNTVMSGGLDARWRAAVTGAVAPCPGQRVLDVGAGTASSSAAIAALGALTVAVDFSPGMLAEARRRHGGLPNLEFVEADATALPFDGDEFDAVTMSYSLRNVHDPNAAIAELFRVTRPGGRLVVAEFSIPANPVLKTLHGVYLARVLPVVARLAGTDGAAYDYLVESIRDWPDRRAIEEWIGDAGWTDIAHRSLSAGIATIHSARKPGAVEVPGRTRRRRRLMQRIRKGRGTSAARDAVRWQRQIPVEVRELSTLPVYDYADAVVATTSRASARSPEEWAVEFRRGAPGWAKALAGAPRPVQDMVIARGTDWILLEEVETLMTTQYVCRVDDDEVILAFLMRYGHPAARLVWPVMSLLHRRVALITLRRIVEELPR